MPDHVYWVSMSCGASVYFPAYAGTDCELTVPIHRGMAIGQAELPGCVVTYRGGLSTHRCLPIPVLTSPDVEQIH